VVRLPYHQKPKTECAVFSCPRAGKKTSWEKNVHLVEGRRGVPSDHPPDYLAATTRTPFSESAFSDIPRRRKEALDAITLRGRHRGVRSGRFPKARGQGSAW